MGLRIGAVPLHRWPPPPLTTLPQSASPAKVAPVLPLQLWKGDSMALHPHELPPPTHSPQALPINLQEFLDLELSALKEATPEL